MPDDLNPGPHIVYRSAVGADGTRRHSLIDQEALDDPRERALCRALLQYALHLLDMRERQLPDLAGVQTLPFEPKDTDA